MQKRVKDTYQINLYQFVRDIWVVCPKCSGKAIVKTGNFLAFKTETDEVKTLCTACGYNKTLTNIPHQKDPKQKQGKIVILGAPIDPFFHLPLWLQAVVMGQTLWAYNPEHLHFLAQHIGAKLRERNGYAYRVKSIGARLPRWMTAATNRTTLLKAIQKLMAK